MKRDTNFLKQNLIAHRGMHNIQEGIPENSTKAFEKAIRNKYIIELDVHILKDNSIVVFHDDNLIRMTGINKKIKDVTYKEIADLRLQNTENKISLLKDVLKLVNGKVPIIIELKTNAANKKIVEEVAKIVKDYNGKFAIKSFSPILVYWFKKYYPYIIRGQLASDFRYDKMNIIKKFLLKNMIFNFITKPDFISYDISGLKSKSVQRFRKKGIVLGWTIKNKGQLEKARKYCDNCICENLDEIDKIRI